MTSSAETRSSQGTDDNPVSAEVHAVIDRVRRGDLGLLPVTGALILIWLFFYVQIPIFLSPRNLSFLLLQIAVVGILAVGIVLVLLLGEIDLSVAATAGVAAASVAVLIARSGWSALPAVGVGFLVAVAIGLFQGFFVAIVKVPSFVVTLAGLLSLQGVMLVILGQRGTVNVNDPLLRSITTTYVPALWGYGIAVGMAAIYISVSVRRRARRGAAGLDVQPMLREVLALSAILILVVAIVWRLNQYLGVPVALLVLLGVAGFWTLMLAHTSFGTQVFAVGGNAEAAHRAGINVARIRMTVMVFAAMTFAFGGIIGASRFASVSYNAFVGGPLLLEAIGAAIIGGTSLFGGRGRVSSALLGALVIGSLSNGLDLFNAGSAIKFIVSGVILLAAVTVDALSRRRRLQAGVA